MRSTGPTILFISLEAATLTKRQNSPLKVQLRCQFRDDTHRVYTQLTPKAMTITLCCVTRGRMHGSGNQGVKVGVSPLTITPSNPLGECMLLRPATSDSVGLEVLFPIGVALLPGESWVIHSTLSYSCHLVTLSSLFQRPADEERCLQASRSHWSCSSAGGRATTTQEEPRWPTGSSLGIPLPNLTTHEQVQQPWMSGISEMNRGSALTT